MIKSKWFQTYLSKPLNFSKFYAVHTYIISKSSFSIEKDNNKKEKYECPANAEPQWIKFF